MPFSALTISQTQNSRIETIKSNLDNAFGAGTTVASTQVTIATGNLIRTGSSPTQVVTATTSTAHTFLPGDQINLQYSGPVDSNYPPGSKYIQSVPDNTHFTYNESGTNIISTQTATAITFVAPMPGYSDDGLMSNGVQGGPDTPPGTANVNRALAKGLSLSLMSALMQNFKLTQLITNHAGLPGSTSFSTGGGTLLMMVSGSAFSTSSVVPISVNLFVDAIGIGTLKTFTNEALSHKAFVPGFIVLSGLSIGSHTLTFTTGANTTVNSDDPYNVTLLELPV